jgi:hypothetical protein
MYLDRLGVILEGLQLLGHTDGAYSFIHCNYSVLKNQEDLEMSGSNGCRV